MNTKIFESIQQMVVPLLKQAGVMRSAVFGSYAMGNESAESDVDILVEFQGEKTLFDLISLKSALEKVLGRKVNLITYRSLSPFLREKILKTQVSLYG